MGRCELNFFNLLSKEHTIIFSIPAKLHVRTLLSTFLSLRSGFQKRISSNINIKVCDCLYFNKKS